MEERKREGPHGSKGTPGVYETLSPVATDIAWKGGKGSRTSE